MQGSGIGFRRGAEIGQGEIALVMNYMASGYVPLSDARYTNAEHHFLAYVTHQPLSPSPMCFFFIFLYSSSTSSFSSSASSPSTSSSFSFSFPHPVWHSSPFVASFRLASRTRARASDAELCHFYEYEIDFVSYRKNRERHGNPFCCLYISYLGYLGFRECRGLSCSFFFRSFIFSAVYAFAAAFIVINNFSPITKL